VPQYKVTFLFNQNRLGWSETYYINLSSLPAVLTATIALEKARSPMLGTGSVLEAARISDVDKPRQCSLYPADELPLNEEFTDTAWNGILVELCAGNNEYHRSLILRGVPDVWIVYNPTTGQMAVTNTATKAFGNFLVQLKKGWQMRVVSKDDADVNKRDVTQINSALNGMVDVTIPGTTAKAGEKIRFTDFAGPDKKKLNKTFEVLKVVGDVVEIRLVAASLTDITENGGGKAWHHKIVYRPITDGATFRPAKKSTGRAFFVPRGRRPKLLPSPS